jgi:hypothetical protein
MEGKLAMFSELGLLDLQHAGTEVDVASVERDRLSHSHAGADQQPEESLVGRSSQGRPQAGGGLHQGCYI